MFLILLPVHRDEHMHFFLNPFGLINLDECFGDKLGKNKWQLLKSGDISSLLHTCNPIGADNLFMNLSLLCVVFDTRCSDYKHECQKGAESRLYAACLMAPPHECVSPVLL